MGDRYAVYYVPAPESPLYRLGSALLGRCAYWGQSLPRPALPKVSEETLARHTRRAAVYGLHGTIVAPFKTEASFDDLAGAVFRAAEGSRAFGLGRMVTRVIDDSFAAIVPQKSPPLALAALERRLVVGMSPYRLPPDAHDLARRGELPPRQAANLKKWGYHLVFEDFKFHLTVADSLPVKPRAFVAAVGGYLNPALSAPLTLDRLGLFHQPAKDEPFICRQVFFLRDL